MVLLLKLFKNLYDKGIEMIVFEVVCFLVKLIYGYIMDLIKKKVDCIFYLFVVYEKLEFGEVMNNFNCFVVVGYLEVICVNVDVLEEKNILMISLFLILDNEKVLIE